MMILYRIYQFCVMMPLLLVITLITCLGCMVSGLLGVARWGGYFFPHWWGKAFCLISLVKVTVKGREHLKDDTSYVFVANHQGAYDIMAVYGYLGHQFRWMMKKGLRKMPMVGLACEMTGHIFVDNSTPSATRQTMECAERQLRGGQSIVVFPEGARSSNGHMRPFKRGAYLLAMEFGLPVVPVTIDGAYDVLPRHRLLPRPGRIVLTIHKPIESIDGKHDLPKLMERSADDIRSVLPERNK